MKMFGYEESDALNKIIKEILNYPLEEDTEDW